MSGITYALIGIAMPASYRMELDSDLETQVFQLIEQLKQTTFEKSNLLFDRFLMNTNATLLIRLPDNTIILPPSSVIFEDSENDNVSTIKENENKVLVGNRNNFSDTVYDLSNAKEYSFAFLDMEKDCSLIVIGGTKSVNQVVTTLLQILPWIIGAIVFISLLAAFFYSHYITRPIVSLSILSKKMAGMELDCRCDESRDDEIGVLASSLNELVQNLAKSLEELKVANGFLQLDIDRERELDRQRMAFFSAVSHELKTPITALQGQLDGMLQNYGSYKDRDKYLAKSLAIAQSMERTIQEIVTISRLDASDFSLGRADFDFSELVRVIAAEYIDFIEQKDMELDINISEHITVNADEKMMKKVLSNLFSNAIRHSPRGEQIVVTSFLKNGCVYFSILNRAC